MTDYTDFDQDGLLDGWKPPSEVLRKVVCAAAKYGEGKDALVVCSARHYDPRMHATLAHLHEAKLFDFEVAGRAVQGFIDQFGVFMDRKEAWKVAVAANQIFLERYPKERWREDDELFSEWLY